MENFVLLGSLDQHIKNKQAMNKCRLCNNNDADFEGSHLISDFILRSMLVDGNINKRSDKIISNRIDTLGTDLFLGREIDEEKVKKILDRDLTEDDRKNNINHYTINNLMCTICEKRLSYLETIFKIDIYDKLSALEVNIKSTSLDSKMTCIFKLFWLSIIWRCSVANFGTFSIDKKSENRIKHIIYNSLGDNVKETRELITKKCSIINEETIGILHVTKTDNYLKNWVFLNPFLQMPYSLIINDFYIFFYSKYGHVKAVKQSMFKLDNEFKLEDYINAPKCSSIKIGIISPAKFDISRKYIYSLKAEDFLKKATELHHDIFLLSTGKVPPKEITASFIDILINEKNVNFNERYKEKRILLKIKENIIKHTK
ncbi:hypothetical protein R9C00_04580 [Flammeovirgaceae bacterium SG7u.111]|nr:hypothetical protein [Flammeovirgaceae bacterium SG7u.132]WPO36722.1 hypothetical protein R9C00_04580 [Flammeovirgaceae bacterium SG7u.111]